MSGIIVLPPNSAASTYELIDAADAVVSFGSSVGYEATYWGKVSIMAGRAIWEDLDVTYGVATANDAAAIIQGDFQSRPRTDCIKLSNFLIGIKDGSNTISWSGGKDYGFKVDGKGYLVDKRASIFYYVNAFFDRLLRIKFN